MFIPSFYRIEFIEKTLEAHVRLYWQANSAAIKSIIPAGNLFYKQYVADSPFDVEVRCPDYYIGDVASYPNT